LLHSTNDPHCAAKRAVEMLLPYLFTSRKPVASNIRSVGLANGERQEEAKELGVQVPGTAPNLPARELLAANVANHSLFNPNVTEREDTTYEQPVGKSRDIEARQAAHRAFDNAFCAGVATYQAVEEAIKNYLAYAACPQ
jgi:hypothetical protein